MKPLRAPGIVYEYRWWDLINWWFQAGEVPVGLLRPRCPLHHHLMVFMIVQSFKPWPHHPQEDHGHCHPLQVLLPPAPRLLPCSHCSPCHRLPLPGKDWDVPQLDVDYGPDNNPVTDSDHLQCYVTLHAGKGQRSVVDYLILTVILILTLFLFWIGSSLLLMIIINTISFL